MRQVNDSGSHLDVPALGLGRPVGPGEEVDYPELIVGFRTLDPGTVEDAPADVDPPASDDGSGEDPPAGDASSTVEPPGASKRARRTT